MNTVATALLSKSQQSGLEPLGRSALWHPALEQRDGDGVWDSLYPVLLIDAGANWIYT